MKITAEQAKEIDNLYARLCRRPGTTLREDFRDVVNEVLADVSEPAPFGDLLTPEERTLLAGARSVCRPHTLVYKLLAVIDRVAPPPTDVQKRDAARAKLETLAGEKLDRVLAVING